MDEKARRERLRALNEMLAHVRRDIVSFLDADDTTLTPGSGSIHKRLMKLEYYLSAYLDRVHEDSD